jgi:hypothetical protein
LKNPTYKFSGIVLNTTHQNVWQEHIEFKENKNVENLHSCLKINGMFEHTDFTPTEMETNHTLVGIRADILEKLSNTINTTNIKIERFNYNVYVSFANNKQAGVAYNSLISAKYKGMLLDIKFLSFERFLLRFPLKK